MEPPLAALIDERVGGASLSALDIAAPLAAANADASSATAAVLASDAAAMAQIDPSQAVGELAAAASGTEGPPSHAPEPAFSPDGPSAAWHSFSVHEDTTPPDEPEAALASGDAPLAEHVTLEQPPEQSNSALQRTVECPPEAPAVPWLTPAEPAYAIEIAAEAPFDDVEALDVQPATPLGEDGFAPVGTESGIQPEITPPDQLPAFVSCLTCFALVDVAGIPAGGVATCRECEAEVLVGGAPHAATSGNKPPHESESESSDTSEADDEPANRDFGWRMTPAKPGPPAPAPSDDHPSGAAAEPPGTRERASGAHPPAPRRASRVIVICKHCLGRVDVSEMEPGRSVMCSGCEGEVVVPDVSGKAPAPKPTRYGAESARDAFSKFYEHASTASGDTRPTVRKADVGSDEARPRPTLADVMTGEVAIHPVPIAVPIPHAQALRRTAIGIAALGTLFLGGLYLKSRWDQERFRAARLAALDPSPPPPPPVQTIEGYLRENERFEVVGIIQNVPNAVHGSARLGALVSTAGVGEVWIEDRKGLFRELFKMLAQRHQSRARTVLRVIGVARPVSLLQLDGLPPTVQFHHVWIDAEFVEVRRYSDYGASDSTVRPASSPPEEEAVRTPEEQPR